MGFGGARLSDPALSQSPWNLAPAGQSSLMPMFMNRVVTLLINCKPRWGSCGRGGTREW
jgi:hypothetical protein